MTSGSGQIRKTLKQGTYYHFTKQLLPSVHQLSTEKVINLKFIYTAECHKPSETCVLLTDHL